MKGPYKFNVNLFVYLCGTTIIFVTSICLVIFDYFYFHYNYFNF